MAEPRSDKASAASAAFTVEAADHHRNGVCGDTFTVALISDAEYGGRFLFIDFHGEEYDDSAAPDYPGFRCTVAAIDVDMAARGNIHMAHGNAWRGDVLADRWRPAIRAFLETAR